MATRYRAVASVTKAHGNRGKVVAVPAAGLPLVVAEGMRVCLVPPDLSGDRFHEVLSAEGDEGGQLLSLSGMADRDAGERAVGKTLLVAVDDLPEGFEAHDVARLLGREVADAARGISGTIAEVALTPANDVWYVDTPDGEMALPVIESVVAGIPEDGPIPVSVPVGLEPERWEAR